MKKAKKAVNASVVALMSAKVDADRFFKPTELMIVDEARSTPTKMYIAARKRIDGERSFTIVAPVAEVLLGFSRK